MCGCAITRHEAYTPRCPTCIRGVVFVVDGAGGFGATSAAFARAVDEAGLPLQVEEVDWTHGPGRVLADQTDSEHSRAEGCRLASRIAMQRQSYPSGKIYVIAHSAGSAVALTAAESLPANTLDRIVLLSPAVCAYHDLRPSLRSSREGIDVFYSDRDRNFLGFWTAVLGTADGEYDCPAAGRVGFAPIVATPEDAALYAKLRQRGWTPQVAWTGNRGGHYGGYQPGHLRAYVLPLLNPCP
jgi:pimeloyl-ACP methyl ester carboxylesterase